MNAARRYSQTQAETASPERIMVLLFEGALRQMRLGIAALEEGRRHDASTSLGRAQEIVMELHGSLDRKQAPELCEQLAGLYVFVATRLVRAAASLDANLAREAERAFEPIADAFRTAVESLGNRAAAAAP